MISDVPNELKNKGNDTDWDFVWYANPKPSIAQEAALFHVQVFWTDGSAIHRQANVMPQPASIKRLPLAFVAKLVAFDEHELQRAATFLRLFECDHAASAVSEVVSALPQSFTPISVSALPMDGTARAAALAELHWLTEKMLEIAVHADHIGGWGYTTSDGVSNCARRLEPSDELIYNRFGDGFSDSNFSWHTDDAEPGPRDISVVAYFTEPSNFEGGELQIQCDATRYRLPDESDYGGNSTIQCALVLVDLSI